MIRRTFLALTTAMALSAPAFADGHSKDIVDTAVKAGSFKTLVAAVQAAGLVDTLKGPGPFTVFAPTDEAFAKVPAATLEALGKDKAALKATLKSSGLDLGKPVVATDTVGCGVSEYSVMSKRQTRS